MTTGDDRPEFSIVATVRVPQDLLDAAQARFTTPRTNSELAALALLAALGQAGISLGRTAARRVPGHLERPVCLCPDHTQEHP